VLNAREQNYYRYTPETSNNIVFENYKEILMKRTIYKISFVLIIVLLVCILVINLSYVAIGMVIKTSDKYIIIEVANIKFYRCVDKIFTGNSDYTTIRLYTQNIGDYSVGQYIFSFTAGGQENSMPPGIRSIFDFLLG
jgi:hypothetical protein